MTHGDAKRGMKSSLYNRWVIMRQRCNNSNTNDYAHYGGRGIRVCDEWNDFEKFKSWAMSNGYREGLMLDRKNNDGDYTPENCRWVDYSTNEFNRRVFKNNRTGVTGVFERSGKYMAYINKGKKRYSLGTFKTIEEAIRARKEAERRLWKNEVEIVENSDRRK